MNGIILTYNVKVGYDFTMLNNDLFGRVAKVKSRKKDKTYHYYYPGLLAGQSIFKLSNGCYFIKGYFTSQDTRVRIIKCTVDLPEDVFYTPEDYFREHYKNVEVVNLG